MLDEAGKTSVHKLRASEQNHFKTKRFAVDDTVFEVSLSLITIFGM